MISGSVRLYFFSKEKSKYRTALSGTYQAGAGLFLLFVFELIYWFFCFHPLNLTALLLIAVCVYLS
jgi:hypothetical protein